MSSNQEDTLVNTENTEVSPTPAAETEYTVLVERLTGIVKWFNNRAGFGFITVCEPGDFENKEIFVHWSSIRVSNSQYRYLFQGEYVDFTLVKANNNNHEYQAMNVSGIKGGPIMCEIRASSNMSNGAPRHRRPYGGGDHEDHGDRPPSRRTDSYRPRTTRPTREPREGRPPREPRSSSSAPTQESDLLEFVKVQNKRTKRVSAAR